MCFQKLNKSFDFSLCNHMEEVAVIMSWGERKFNSKFIQSSWLTVPLSEWGGFVFLIVPQKQVASREAKLFFVLPCVDHMRSFLWF